MNQPKYKFIENLRFALKRYNGIFIETNLKPYRGILQKIREYQYADYTDAELKELSKNLKQRLESGEPPDDILPSAFALVNEACCRILKIIPFDEQIIAGIVLHQGKLAEMPTGEGKTLAAVFPVYLNALTGKGVMVLTANSYLAKRDAEWMGKIYEYLGLSVGYIQEKMTVMQRKIAYHKDITYLTVKEAGFDYLRDGLCYDSAEIMQRDYHYSIVDEADFILIDEARVPMVIAGMDDNELIDFFKIISIIKNLIQGIDYQLDFKIKNVYLTDSGIQKVEEALLCGSIYDEKNFSLLCGINVSLQALVFLKEDIDYIIREGKILLIDELTGRVADNRRWPHGIQNALEAKHQLEVQPEGKIMNSITIQHFIKLFPKIAAMTATAVHSADDFAEVYRLTIVIIPPHKPCIRQDLTDRVFLTKKAKYYAIVQEVNRAHTQGRPVLIGTESIKESETLSQLLNGQGIFHQVLNAKNDEKEAHIIAQAGMLNAVTISTNMAGRGTDIHLGGENEEKKAEVVKLGGLLIIGTVRFESRRIDQQLAGRSGRQGDPGACIFFISLEDHLINHYQLVNLIPPELFPKNPEEPIESKEIAQEIAHAQRVIGHQHFQTRDTLIKYSLLVEIQRHQAGTFRKNMLLGKEQPDYLIENCPIEYQTSLNLFGEKKLLEIEKQLTIFYLDRFWADHLEKISILKEGLHLFLYSNDDPLQKFNEKISNLYSEGIDQMENNIINRFIAVHLILDQFQPAQEGIKGPASTLTYFIDDNPFRKMQQLAIFFKNTGMNIGIALTALFIIPVIFIGNIIQQIKKRFNNR